MGCDCSNNNCEECQERERYEQAIKHDDKIRERYIPDEFSDLVAYGQLNS